MTILTATFCHDCVQGGGFYLLGVQTLEMVSIAAWTAVVSFLLLKAIDFTVGLRLDADEEEVRL